MFVFLIGVSVLIVCLLLLVWIFLEEEEDDYRDDKNRQEDSQNKTQTIQSTEERQTLGEKMVKTEKDNTNIIYAGFWLRLIAYIIDGTIIIIISFIINE